MKWNLFRHGDWIYRWRGEDFSGGPLEVQAFEKNPEIRHYNGRWFDCPRIAVHRAIANRKRK